MALIIRDTRLNRAQEDSFMTDFDDAGPVQARTFARLGAKARIKPDPTRLASLLR